ncbi:cytoplasmic protein [Kwoniella heveanensis CBS 569]|nr:cytoplasmic protein [Kwoniella heveanensis CBS 569]
MSDSIIASLPGVKQKVIGLVSGGKDSCFNLMHCIANGHELVALATLTPEPGIDELDSHLYQSVGTHLLPLLAKSMDLPLYTRVIKGKAVEKGPEYGSRLRGGEGSGEEGDETEDLTKLLNEVMVAHPEATSLASGAILSTYQRLRIEHVCARLNLVSLSYLWQSEQMPLLNRMLSSGVEAVLMKVAGVGLSTKIVGKQLAEIMPLLTKLEATYGSHPAGEGGEYETLTLSTPLFSHRLKLVKTHTIITDPEPYPVAYLKVEETELEAKEGWRRPTVAELRVMLGLDESARGEEALNDDSKELLKELRQVVKYDVDLAAINLNEADRPEQPALDAASTMASGGATEPKVRFERKGRWFSASVQGVTKPAEDVGSELKACFDAIAATLQAESLSLPLHSTHITLLLRSMSDFLPANAVYKTYFGTSPPSRATVAVPLETGRIRVEVVGFDDAPALSTSSAADQKKQVLVGGRNALHVQGLSYWAPANIGPYSQAVMVNSRLHLAGQIPLLPSSLTLPNPHSTESPYLHQSVLALQHVRSIVDVMRSKNSTGGGWQGWIEGAVAWWAKSEISTQAKISADGEGVTIARKAWGIWAEMNGASSAPVAFVQARELPKGALVEFQINLHTGRQSSGQAYRDADDGDDDDEELEAIYASGKEDNFRWESCMTSGKRAQGSRAVIFLGADLRSFNGVLSSVSNDLQAVLRRAVTIRIYHLPGTESELTRMLELVREEVCKFNFTLVPVLSVHDRDGRPSSAALEVFGV